MEGNMSDGTVNDVGFQLEKGSPKKVDVTGGISDNVGSQKKRDSPGKEPFNVNVPVPCDDGAGVQMESCSSKKDPAVNSDLIVDDKSPQPENAWSIMLDAHVKAVVKQEEFEMIRNVVRIFGIKGATLSDICVTFEVLHGRPIDKILLRELIAEGQLTEILRTGRVFVESGYNDVLTMYDLANQ